MADMNMLRHEQSKMRKGIATGREGRYGNILILSHIKYGKLLKFLVLKRQNKDKQKNKVGLKQSEEGRVSTKGAENHLLSVMGNTHA